MISTRALRILVALAVCLLLGACDRSEDKLADLDLRTCDQRYVLFPINGTAFLFPSKHTKFYDRNPDYDAQPEYRDPRWLIEDAFDEGEHNGICRLPEGDTLIAPRLHMQQPTIGEMRSSSGRVTFCASDDQIERLNWRKQICDFVDDPSVTPDDVALEYPTIVAIHSHWWDNAQTVSDDIRPITIPTDFECTSWDSISNTVWHFCHRIDVASQILFTIRTKLPAGRADALPLIEERVRRLLNESQKRAVEYIGAGDAE